MAVNLKKGQKVDLTKTHSGLNHLHIGLGWDINKYDGDADFDLDVSAFLLGENGKVRNSDDFIYYNNLSSKDKSVVHTGDNRTGEGDGDDEVINVKLSDIAPDVHKISLVITIHDAETLNHNFGQVSESYVRVLDMRDNNEIIRYDLGEDFSIETSIVVGELYRHQGEWKFTAIGSGYQGGLESACKDYGLDVEA